MNKQTDTTIDNNCLEIKKADIILITAVLLIAGIAVIFMLRQKSGDRVNIYINGEMSSYSLMENKEIVLNNGKGGYNKAIIENKTVYVQEANCPNQICVHHKPIYRNGESIVCVPNNISIIVESSVHKDVDN